MGSIPVRVTKKETIHPDGFFFGDSYVGPNPLGSIARQFHAQAWQRYVMPLVLTCGQNKCRGDTEPTQSAEYSRTGQQLIYRVRIPQETIHPDGFFFGDSYVGPNPLGSIARQFHAQAWQRYVMPLVLTCGQNKCRGDTEPTQPAEYSRTVLSLIHSLQITQKSRHPYDAWIFSLLRTPLRSEHPRDGRKNIKNWNPNDAVRRILSHSAWNSCGFQGSLFALSCLTSWGKCGTLCLVIQNT